MWLQIKINEYLKSYQVASCNLSLQRYNMHFHIQTEYNWALNSAIDTRRRYKNEQHLLNNLYVRIELANIMCGTLIVTPIIVIVNWYSAITDWRNIWIFFVLFVFFLNYLSVFSWRSVIRLRSFLFVYGTISGWSLESFSCCSPPLNGKVRLPFELCSSPVDVSIFLKLCWIK